MHCRSALSVVALCGLLSVQVMAGPMSGRLTTELYTYDRGDTSHVRPYVRLTANWKLWKSTHRRSASLHTSLRWTSDFADQLPTDPQFFVYDTYLRFTNPIRGLTLNLGRQFAYIAGGNAHLDGVRLRFDHRKVLIEAYGGSRVSRLDPETIRSIEDFGAWGVQVLAKAGRRGRFGLHFSGHDDDGALARNVLGAVAEWNTRKWHLYGRYGYDLIDRKSSLFLGRIRYTRADWNVRAEYSRREPVVAANSIFSLINASPYNQVRLTVRRKVSGLMSAIAGLNATAYDSGSTWRGRLGLTSPAWSLIGQLQSGDRGDLAGLQGHISPYTRGPLRPYARFSLNRYAVQEEQAEKIDAHTIAAGVSWRGAGSRSLRGEVQWFRNAMETNASRLFVQFVQGFYWSPGGSR